MTEIRKELQWFSQEMETKLKKNDHKGGWDKSTISWLLGRLKDEVKELEEVLNEEPETNTEQLSKMQRTIAECADVANFAMMIADKTNTEFQPMLGDFYMDNWR